MTDPLTPRQLLAMARARREEAWGHTAWTCATIRNAVAGILGGEAVAPDECNPLRLAEREARREEEQGPKLKRDLQALKRYLQARGAINKAGEKTGVN